MSCSTKSVKTVPGFWALSATVRRRSSRRGSFLSTGGSAGFSGGVSGGLSAGLVACGSAGLISFRNSSRSSPSGVKMRLSVTFSSFGLSFFVVGNTRSPIESIKLSRELQRLGQEGVDALPGVVRGVLDVALLVVRIHEGVPGAGIDFDVRRFSGRLQRLLERFDVFRRNAAVGAAEVAEDRRAQLGHRGRIGDEVAV